MTEREKIIKVIDEWANKAVKANKFDGASVYNPYNAAELADTLVAAGIGDIREAEHCAEVAERALRRKCESEADSTCPCDENSDKCRVCAEKRLCSTEYATQCYYEKAIHQAEREIEEEIRDESNKDRLV